MQEKQLDGDVIVLMRNYTKSVPKYFDIFVNILMILSDWEEIC